MKHKRFSKSMLAMLAVVGISLTGCAQDTNGTESSPEASANLEGEALLDASNDELREMLPDDVRESGKLRVGAAADHSPFSSMPDGTMVGIIPDLADEVGEVLGVDIEFVAGPIGSQIPAIQSDRIDIIWALMVATKEREKVVDFVSYIQNGSAFLVKKGNPHDIADLGDLCGKSPAALRGSIQAPVLEDQREKCASNDEDELNVLLYDGPSDAQTAITAGKADAFLGGAVQFHELAEEVDDGNAFEVVRDEETYADTLGIGVSKDEPGLAKAVQGSLMKIIEDGSYEDVLTEYGAEDDAYSTDEIVINPATTEALKE